MECALQRKNKVWIYLSNEDPGISQDKQAKLGIKTHHVSHHNYETENSTCRILSEKKTRSCNKHNQLSFCHECFSLCSLSLLSRGWQCAATGTAFHLLGVVVLLEYFRKKFCTPELSCQSPSSVFTLGTYYSCLALSRLEIRYWNAFWLVSLYGAAQHSFVFATAPQTNCSAQKLLPLRSLLKTWWRLSRLVSLFNFHSHISGSN